MSTRAMKIAIVGAGVAGSYLSNVLSRDHEVTVYERHSKRNFECVCAWGTSKTAISRFAEHCGLDFADYILHEGEELRVSVAGIEATMELCGLVSFDKHRFVLDMQKGQKIQFGTWVRDATALKDQDLVIDATGLRALLPRIQREEMRIPCVQYMVEYGEQPPFDDFYLEILEGFGGYLWYFPLQDGFANVGAGDANRKHQEALRDFLHRYGGRPTKLVGRPIRICPPRNCEPIFKGKVVGVGESVGTVFPPFGEGIIPTLQSSEILAENVADLPEYRRQLLRHFRFYPTAFDWVKPYLSGEVRPLEQAVPTVALIFHLMANEARYGSRVSFSDVTVDPVAFLVAAVSTVSRLRLV
jgi:flavin-dependent dehydrogenase